METQVLVIGAGPGGYVAAIKLGKLGKRALLVDRDALGGECLNYGCIPSKALISASGIVHKAKKAGEIGINLQLSGVDMSKIQAWRAGIITGSQRGIATLEKGNNVQVLMGEARFTGANTAEITTEAGGADTVSFEHAIIATGSRPMEIPGFSIDGVHVLANKEALELAQIPGRLLVIGGGVIGLEIGTYFAKLGTQVTVVEMMGQILPGVEPDLTQPVLRALTKLGVTVHLNAKAGGYVQKDGALEVSFSTAEGEQKIVVDKILLSVGRTASSGSLNLAAAGVNPNPRGYVPVNESYQTNVPNIYAIGDIVGPPFLAHKASREGILAALHIATGETHPLGAVPSVIFTDPEVASVGITEAQARDHGLETVQGRFPFSASGRAQTTRETDGFVKVLAEKTTGKILGVGVVGPGASDIISEACLAVKLGATLEDVSSTIHPHPTLPEAFMEACEAAMGQAIHILAPVRR
ncbi:MAG: dihydrolipoyl dehydrogenase [Elusimicrobia bacterium]|nr:dihydrolipoyl dehydrogenase [Elusimicrobiota bacterium]